MGIYVNTALCMQDLRTLIRYYFDTKIYMWEHFELELKFKLKLSNMYTYTLYHIIPITTISPMHLFIVAIGVLLLCYGTTTDI